MVNKFISINTLNLSISLDRLKSELSNSNTEYDLNLFYLLSFSYIYSFLNVWSKIISIFLTNSTYIFNPCISSRELTKQLSSLLLRFHSLFRYTILITKQKKNKLNKSETYTWFSRILNCNKYLNNGETTTSSIFLESPIAFTCFCRFSTCYKRISTWHLKSIKFEQEKLATERYI
jgi:hypothetical protein